MQTHRSGPSQMASYMIKKNTLAYSHHLAGYIPITRTSATCSCADLRIQGRIWDHHLIVHPENWRTRKSSQPENTQKPWSPHDHPRTWKHSSNHHFDFFCWVSSPSTRLPDWIGQRLREPQMLISAQYYITVHFCRYLGVHLGEEVWRITHIHVRSQEKLGDSMQDWVIQT